MFYETTATRKVARLSKKIRAVQGGTSASKTISILLVLIALAQTDEKPTLTSIVAESFPHLKKGALRDFKKIMKAHNYWREDAWSVTDSIYTFETGSQIEFFGADQSEKLRGSRRDRGFMNECNNLSLEAFDEFEVRTREFVFIDWNPTIEFWFYTDVQGMRDDVEHIVLTYKDNEACPPEIVASIEQRQNRKRWWQVYGLGLLGDIEGRIYTGWSIIEEIPHEAKLVRRGLDFGYTNDPTALVDVYEYNGGYIIDERLYKKGMQNKQIADVINGEEEDVLVIADSSEPKSIDDIAGYGVTILGAKKQKKEEVGKGESYLKWSIGVVQDAKISVTKRSANVISEYRKYLWMSDKDGKLLNVPEDIWNHAMDAIRYAVVSLVKPPKTSVTVHAPQWQGYNRTAPTAAKQGVIIHVPTVARRKY